MIADATDGQTDGKTGTVTGSFRRESNARCKKERQNSCKLREVRERGGDERQRQ